MRTREEIAEWLSGHICEDGEYCKIYSFLTKIGVESHWSFFRVKIDSKEIHNGYESFIAWFNEPNEKVEDEVTEMTLDTFESLVKRCVDGFNILFKPYKNEYNKKFLVRANPVSDNILYDLFKSFQQDLEINDKELKVTNPKFPIGTKVVRKSKPNGKVYTISERSLDAKGYKDKQYRYIAVADDGSYMYGVRESKLMEHKEEVEPKFNERNEITSLIGIRKEMLTIIEDLGMIETSQNGKTRHFVLCRCDCGVVKRMRLSSFQHKGVKSCGCFRSKERHNTLKKIIDGVGVNDYTGIISGLKSYNIWRNMIKRCYNNKVQSRSKNISYIGCSVCDEWLYFTNFKRWFDENYVEGYHLDKDILVKGNKMYSPQTCCFVPNEINVLFTNIRKNNQDYIGIKKCGNLYQARINLRGKHLHLGSYLSNIDACDAYKSARNVYLDFMATYFLEKGAITEDIAIGIKNHQYKCIEIEKSQKTLIKAVEEEYYKTYCEETKQWVDVKPKSAIDEFNEKQEVRIKRGKDGAFNVYVGDFCTDFLSYDEMLGTVAALLTPPDIRERKCLHWLKTKEQHLISRCISPELREEMGITDEEYENVCNR